MYQPSQYNYFVPYRGKIIYYNSLRRSSFAMTTAEHQKIRKLFEDPISFSLEYPSVFKQFYQWGFFVDAYTNEASLFRYQYNKDVVFNSRYHLVLVSTPQQEFSTANIELIVKHIKQVLDLKEISALCVEWRGRNVLNGFKTFIYPLYNRAKKLCEKQSVDFSGQIEINLSNNETIHNKLYHNKGVPTYEQTLQAVRYVHRQFPCFRLRVRVNAFSFGVAARENFLNQFDDDARKRIHWVWEPQEMWQGVAEKTNNVAFYRKCLNEGCEEFNPEQTYALLAPRKNVAVICPDRNVYMMSVHLDFTQETPAEGTLSETDGTIHWEEAAREKRLSQLWFGLKECTDCRHLPLFAGVCPLLFIKAGQICPIDNHLIEPETMIVKEFESKQT